MKFFSLLGRRGDLLSPTPGDRHPQMRLAHIDFWKSKIKKFHIDPLVTETFPGYVEAFLDLFAAPRNKTPLKKQTKNKFYYKASSRSPNPNFRMFGIFKVLKIFFSGSARILEVLGTSCYQSSIRGQRLFYRKTILEKLKHVFRLLSSIFIDF